MRLRIEHRPFLRVDTGPPWDAFSGLFDGRITHAAALDDYLRVVDELRRGERERYETDSDSHFYSLDAATATAEGHYDERVTTVPLDAFARFVRELRAFLESGEPEREVEVDAAG